MEAEAVAARFRQVCRSYITVRIEKGTRLRRPPIQSKCNNVRRTAISKHSVASDTKALPKLGDYSR